MTDAYLEFEWRVAVEGYEWTKTEVVNQSGSTEETSTPSSHAEQLTRVAQSHPSQSRWYLTSGYGFTAQNYRVRRYDPLNDRPTLFRQFAQTELRREAIREFANQYGALGGDLAQKIRIPSEVSRSNRETAGFGERLSSWKEEISSMRQAITLTELVRDKSVKELSNYIKWTSPDRVLYQSHTEDETDPEFRVERVIAASNKRPELLDKFPEGDLIRPAQCQIHWLVNNHISERVKPRLLQREDLNQLRMGFVPESLIGALWLQFSESIHAG